MRERLEREGKMTKAIERAKAKGWETNGNSLPPTKVGNPKKDAEAKLMTLGFKDNAGIWTDGTETAYISGNGTVWFS